MNYEYTYIGPDALRQDASAGIPRSRLGPNINLRQLRQTLELDDTCENTLTLTFIVDVDSVLWVADRYTEHVACARGGNVLAAGELTVIDQPSGGVEVIAATNQSTGYCPEPTSWMALAAALDNDSIPHPDHYEYEFHFRLCTACHARVLVKDDIFECDECEAQLSKEWNFG